jgi:putative toxin-antitoxin system antitoxin component (TIGR02293 family)
MAGRASDRTARLGEAKQAGGLKITHRVKLPDPADVNARGPLGRVCRVLGISPVRSDVEFWREVKRGLPVSSIDFLAKAVREANLPVTEITEMVVPRRTLGNRRRGNQPLTTDESDKLARVARVIVLSEDVFADRGKAVAWLRKPKSALDGLTPIAALATDTGARLVENMLHQIDHGIDG